jgi:Flp pilus assembly protein TadD
VCGRQHLAAGSGISPSGAIAAPGSYHGRRFATADRATLPRAKTGDRIFEQLLKDPKNIDLTLRYAEAAAKLGNYEAAISSLERLLLLDRNFPGVRL